MEKKLLRKIHMEKLARLDEKDRRACDLAICENVISIAEYERAEKVFLYISVGTEVSTRRVVRHAIEAGKEVYIPICHGGGIMHAARLMDEAELIDGMYGIPTVPDSNPKISPDELDLILVPGVCFDRSGNRLGRGGGYYDRYLAQKMTATTIGICRDEQLLEALNADVHDRRVDIIVSDKEILKLKK